jgi:hypothetical protein
MSERDVDPDQILARARGYLEPRAGAAERVLAALRDQGLQPLHGNDVSPRPEGLAAEPRTGGRAASHTATAKLVGVGVITGTVGFLLGLAIGRQNSAERELRTSRALTEHSLVEQAHAPNALEAPPSNEQGLTSLREAVAATAEVEATRGDDAARKVPTQRAPRSKPERARAPLPLSFREALELLRRAQAAQRLGRAGEAFEHLDQLDQRAEKELLREERLLTRALASCDVGDVEEARRLAAELEQENATSIYSARLRQSCTGSGG